MWVIDVHEMNHPEYEIEKERKKHQQKYTINEQEDIHVLCSTHTIGICEIQEEISSAQKCIQQRHTIHVISVDWDMATVQKHTIFDMKNQRQVSILCWPEVISMNSRVKTNFQFTQKQATVA